MSEQEFKQARQKKTSRHNTILRAKADTFNSSPRSWLHLGHDGKIYFVNQRFGEKATGQVKLSRAEFEQFVKFYERGKQGMTP